MRPDSLDRITLLSRIIASAGIESPAWRTRISPIRKSAEGEGGTDEGIDEIRDVKGKNGRQNQKKRKE